MFKWKTIWHLARVPQGNIPRIQFKSLDFHDGGYRVKSLNCFNPNFGKKLNYSLNRCPSFRKPINLPKLKCLVLDFLLNLKLRHYKV